jgi:histidine triad (HIT) family protein
MAECNICRMIETNTLKKIYEDETMVGCLSDEPAAEGHILIIPKKHYPIIEQIPDFEFGKIMSVANKISISLFEILHVQGTNIFVQNGVGAGQKHSHSIINIIPRMPNDSINLNWQPKQLTEEEMSTVELKIKEQIKTVGYFEREKQKPVDLDRKPEVISDEEDYLVKSLRRIP